MCKDDELTKCAVRFHYNEYSLDFEGTMVRANDRDALAKAYIKHVMEFEGACSVCSEGRNE